MASPDLTDLNDLILYDKTADALNERGLLDAGTKMPAWLPQTGDTAVVMLESLSLIAAEEVYAINRLPGAVMDVLLRLLGITRSVGAAPTVTVRFTSSTGQPLDIPAGSITQLTLADGSTLNFTTNLHVTGPGPTLDAASTAVLPTSAANGIASGTPVAVISSLPSIDSAALSTTVAAGTDPEDETAWRTRGVQQLQRLASTLVAPAQFVSAALTNALVYRALAIDAYTPSTLSTPAGVTATASTTGGTLAAATYSYRVSAVNKYGETVASAAVTAVTSGTTGSVAVAWNAVTATNGAAPVTGYHVFGRVGGSEGLLATVTATSYTDTGAAAVGAASSATNSTGGPVGDFPGYIAVAVLGSGGAFLASADKSALQSTLAAQSQANLAVNVIDPTITNVTVTATVHPLVGFTTAQVQANVAAALTAYLSPDTWLWSATVRRNKLIQVIEDAAGVDYLTTLTAPAADLTLAGVAPLAKFDTTSVITVT